MGATPYITMHSGQRVTLERGTGVPKMTDIILSHCRTPMYAGQTEHFYSVAHHCLSASEIALECEGDPAVAYFTLWHEVETAVFGDIPGPVKCSQQRSHEKDLRWVIWKNLFDGRVPSEEQWWKVELFDKLEQRASISFLGLEDQVHDSVWNLSPANFKEIAYRITRANFEKYPPRDQLHAGSPLYGTLAQHMTYLTRLI